MFEFLPKSFIALAGTLGVLLIAGFTGLTFFLWPTSFGDHPLDITTNTISKLREIQQEKKFLEDLPNHYPGAPSEAVRAHAQDAVDGLIHTLADGLQSQPSRSFVLGAMKNTLASFSEQDTEEQERMLFYCERILAILGINDSGELFNVWRYGFPYRWLSKY